LSDMHAVEICLLSDMNIYYEKVLEIQSYKIEDMQIKVNPV